MAQKVFRITKDKECLIITSPNGGEQSYTVKQVTANLAALKKQKDQQIQQYDTRIAEFQEYADQIKMLSKK